MKNPYGDITSGLDGMYRDIVLEHAKDPRNFGLLAGAEVKHEGYNPMCGDRVCLELKLNGKGDGIDRIQFTGHGCSICVASTSMMTEQVEGCPIRDALQKVQGFRDVLQGKVPTRNLEGDLEALSGVKQFPVRIKCALLPWITLKEAIEIQATEPRGGDNRE